MEAPVNASDLFKKNKKTVDTVLIIVYFLGPLSLNSTVGLCTLLVLLETYAHLSISNAPLLK